MINKILTGIFKIIIKLVSLLLYPIDSLIGTLLPSLSTALSGVANFFNYIGTAIGWVISLTGLSSEAISLIVLYYGFILTAPIVFYTIKLALSWYDKLKP